MSWYAGEDVSTGQLITAARWNQYNGANGSLEYLKGRFNWKSSTSDSLSLSNKTSSVSWTDLDLTSVTSADAKLAWLILMLTADSVGANGYALLGVRKNGETPTDYPYVVMAESLGHTGGPTSTQAAEVIVGMDSGQVVEYQLYIAGTIQVDAKIKVLGYIE